jgi:hypothetical protein
VVEKVLTGQSVHTDDAVAENEPMLQALQVMGLDAHSIGDAVPDGQSMNDASSLEPNVPVGHFCTRRMELESVVMVPWLRPEEINCAVKFWVLKFVPDVPSILRSRLS